VNNRIHVPLSFLASWTLGGGHALVDEETRAMVASVNKPSRASGVGNYWAGVVRDAPVPGIRGHPLVCVDALVADPRRTPNHLKKMTRIRYENEGGPSALKNDDERSTWKQTTTYPWLTSKEDRLGHREPGARLYDHIFARSR